MNREIENKLRMEIMEKHMTKTEKSDCFEVFFDYQKAMEEYAKIKMIDENKSLLEMAKLHMDSRAVLVISERISELEK